MSLAVEVLRTSIRLRTVTGEDLEVTVFIHTVAHADFRPESVGDRLNDPEAEFLPCEIDGESHLVRLSSIAFVEVDETPPEVDALLAVGATRSSVELQLQSGDRLRGDLLYEAERGEERVSDMFNRFQSRFVILVDGERTYFVHSEAIDRIKL